MKKFTWNLRVTKKEQLSKSYNNSIKNNQDNLFGDGWVTTGEQHTTKENEV